MGPARSENLEHQVGGGKFSRADMRDVVRPHPVGAQEKCPEKRAGEKQDEQEEEMEHLNLAQEKVGGEYGLSHYGYPQEEEVTVLEEPEEEVPNAKPRVLRAPRMPTQKEVHQHAATHLPHQSWCENMPAV